MSATAGPIVPSISGRLLVLLEPSSDTVTDRLAEPLMRVFLSLARRLLAVKRLPLAWRLCETMADSRRAQPSRLQHSIVGRVTHSAACGAMVSGAPLTLWPSGDSRMSPGRRPARPPGHLAR